MSSPDETCHTEKPATPTDKLTLEQIGAAVSECRKCPLCEGRTNAVLGSGNKDASVMLVGEAPGKYEDLKGKPFVGAAGKLLDELLVKANLKREDIYIANVLKCRPPSNRNPQPFEIEQCADFLRAQTRVIHPDIIVTLGNFATQFILKSESGITALRGRIHRRGRLDVLPVFHPAAALYDPSKKQILMNDFAMLGKHLSTNPYNNANSL